LSLTSAAGDAGAAGLRGRAAVTWLGHATVLVELDGQRLLTDPILHARVGPLLRVAAPAPGHGSADIDAVLISHLHADHTHIRSLRRLGGTRTLAPAGAGRWLAARGLRDVEELRAGEWVSVGEVAVCAVPARHGRGRWSGRGGAEPLGFVIAGSSSCYFAGDTDIFAGMARLNGVIDVALLPVAGWGPTLGPGHLDPARAAQAAAVIAPRLAVPIHWGTLALPGGRRLAPRPAAPERLFAELAAERAPTVEVRVPRVGERIELPGSHLGPLAGAPL
jgi:L-ascorbate metabolism protein UlaG (beta-lactamase superfamily)